MHQSRFNWNTLEGTTDCPFVEHTSEETNACNLARQAHTYAKAARVCVNRERRNRLALKSIDCANLARRLYQAIQEDMV